MNSTAVAMDHVVDLRNLKFIPKNLFENLIGHGNREKTVGQLAELVDALLSDDPCNISLEGLGFNACYQLGRDHRAYWSGADTGATVIRIINNVRSVTPFNERNKMTIFEARDKLYEKTGNKISNIAAETLLGRSSKPYYAGVKGTYPPKKEGDQRVTHEANRALDPFGIGPQNGNNRPNPGLYQTSRPTVDLLVKTTLVDHAGARAAVYSAFKKWPRFDKRGPDTKSNLGALLHNIPEDRAITYIMAIACHGCFKGHPTWPRFNKVLIQGAWPWLRGYTEAFAKTVFTAMVALFAALELDLVNSAVKDLLVALAKTLIGRSETSWKVRSNCRLDDAKVRIAAVDELEESDASKAAKSPGDKQEEWTLNTLPEYSTNKDGRQTEEPDVGILSMPNLDSDHPAPGIIPGKTCNHGPALYYHARVKVAHSLAQVADHIRGGSGITVALTLGNEEARAEVEAYAIKERIVSVKRTKDQCIYCACRLAHATAALLVIG